ncbi:MAG: LAGLIDADG family homing endonuclease [Sarcina sp.]
MNETDAAYIAGIIDGEGSILLTKLSQNTHRAPVVSVPSTTIELLEYLKKTIGFGKIIRKTNYNKAKHKDCYTYILERNGAIELLKEISPYLIIKSKKKRADLILRKYKALTPRNGRYTEEMLIEKELFYKKFASYK